jgi:hypothetical protein
VLALNSGDSFGAQLGLHVDDLIVKWCGKDLLQISDLRLDGAVESVIECVVLRPIANFSMWSSDR